MTSLAHQQWFGDDGAMQKVTGFITPRAARMISAILTCQLQSAILGGLAEIGVFYGKTFVGLALAARPGERVLGMDIFPGDTKPKLVELVKASLPKDYAAEVVVSTADSAGVSAAEWIRQLGPPARFVHVDGDHTYRAVMSDILLADSHLAEGGVVVIDDFLHDWYPDVTEGVFDALKVARNLRPVAVIPRSGDLMEGGTKLVCCTPSAVETYAELVRTTFPGVRFRNVGIAGYDALSMLTV